MDRLNHAGFTRKALLRAISALEEGDLSLCQVMIQLAWIECRKAGPGRPKRTWQRSPNDPREGAEHLPEILAGP